MTDHASLTQNLKMALQQPNLFPMIDLTKCRRLNSFQKVQRCKEIKVIQKLFEDCSLPVRMGYNMGTQDVSFTMNLPSLESHPIRTLEELWKESKAAFVLWTLLAISPTQSTIENEEGPTSLANQCMKTFREQSSMTICGRFLDLARGYLRIVLCPYDDTLDPSTGREEYVYSPRYHSITGWCPKTNKFTEESLAKQKMEFVDSMVDRFWWHMEEKKKYIAVDTLRDALTVSLSDYLTRGLQGQSAFFLAPYSCPFHFYLYGTAGIGKSAFVRGFASSLQFVLRTFVDPSKVVQTVKVPLNAFTAGNLKGILRVKGISDMSIERIIEQTLCKGGIVVFHLEENPDDPFLQEALFSQTTDMLQHLVKRYPEYRANILTVTTSNYSPAPSLAAVSTLLTMKALNYKEQVRWCSMMLKDAISGFLEEKFKIILDVQAQTPQVTDLRPLEQWWRSLAFGIGSHIKMQIYDEGEEKREVLVVIQGEDGWYDITFPTFESWGCLSMSSFNSFFYYNIAEEQSDLLVEKFQLPPILCPIITTLVRMAERGFLKPAVIVLVGEEEKRRKWGESIAGYLRDSFGSKLRHVELELFAEDDKVKVFGEPREILGGLFRFIDRVNNPNACDGEEDRFGLIYSHVNEIGQFILRELLEPGNSKTHRQIAKKDRLLFVMSLVEYAQLTPQSQSRCHFIIQCE